MNLMTNIEILTLSKASIWRSLLEELPIEQQDIYFTPEYYRLHEKNGDGKAICFVYRNDGNLALYPFLLNSVNLLGFNLNKEYYDIQGVYGYNGVVASCFDSSFIKKFYNAFDGYCKNSNIIAEFTRFHPLMRNELFSMNNIDTIVDRQTIFLDLNLSYEHIWKYSFSSINRNMIRKAIKNEIKIEVSNNIKLFYSIYSLTMQNVGADEYYYFSESYFKNIKELLKEDSEFLVAWYKGEPICVMILLVHKKYAHYHLSGRKNEYSNLGVNNYILNESIKYAKDRNCEVFHFGGGTSGNDSDSLLKFKSNFSKEKSEFIIGKRILNADIYHSVINQWENKYPEKVTKYKNMLLRYRY